MVSSPYRELCYRNMSDRHRVFSTLDNPPRILFWPLDVFLIMVGPAFVGLAIGFPLLILAGFIVKPLYQRLKRRYPRGSFRHRLYWQFPQKAFGSSGPGSSFPPSYIREYLL